MTDASTALPNPNYVTELGPAASATATTAGFRFEAYARYLTDYGGGANMGLSVYLNQRAYHLMFDLNAAGDLQATLYGRAGSPSALTTGGTGTARYHRFSLESAGGNSLTATFDGRSLGGWTGVGVTAAHANTVLWGNSNQALSARGAMAFNSVSLELGPIVDLPGDFDDSTSVDGVDFLAWQRTLGSTTQLAADGNNDLSVNSPDLAVWKSHYGQQAPSGVNAAGAPEPEGVQLSLIAVAALALLNRSQRNRSRPRLHRRRATAGNKADQEQHDEHDKQNLGDVSGRSRDDAHAKHPRDNRDNQKCERPLKHGRNSCSTYKKRGCVGANGVDKSCAGFAMKQVQMPYRKSRKTCLRRSVSTKPCSWSPANRAVARQEPTERYSIRPYYAHQPAE